VILPAAVVLTCPRCLLASLPGRELRGTGPKHPPQVGMWLLIVTGAKNAILIVELRQPRSSRGGPRKGAEEAGAHAPSPI